ASTVRSHQLCSRTTRTSCWTGISPACDWRRSCTNGSRETASATARCPRSARGAPMRTPSSPCPRVPGSENVTLAYRLPNGTVPVLLSADTPELLISEAAALHAYATDHPEIAPDAIAAMLFRTRIARRHRALAMVA